MLKGQNDSVPRFQSAKKFDNVLSSGTLYNVNRRTLTFQVDYSYRESNPGLSGPSNESLKADDVNPYTIPDEVSI